MKDARTSFLLALALVFFLISLALFYTLTYYKFNFKSNAGKITSKPLVKNQSATAGEYEHALQKINDTPFSMAPIIRHADTSQQFDRLQRNPTSSSINITTTGERNKESIKLPGFEKKPNKPDSLINKAGARNERAPSLFTVSRLHLTGVLVTNGTEQETAVAGQTEKLIASFNVKNSFTETNYGEIIVVVTQPDGHVLQSSPWESGTFDTPEGRKIYSSKFHLEYTPGETKQLLFSVNSDSFQKGEYAMQVYANKIMIAKATKTLL